jgi:hypothetical protein
MVRHVGAEYFGESCVDFESLDIVVRHGSLRGSLVLE